MEELEALSGVKGITDIHREKIDHITIPSKQGKGVLKRVEEVFDCWFESGRYESNVDSPTCLLTCAPVCLTPSFITHLRTKNCFRARTLLISFRRVLTKPVAGSIPSWFFRRIYLAVHLGKILSSQVSFLLRMLPSHLALDFVLD